MRVVGVVNYDGTCYQGFQRQAGVPTVQGALEQALAACSVDRPTVYGAGRTDSGVHAIGQVIAADVPWRHEVSALRRAWNAYLPQDICMTQLYPAPGGFNPRFDALARTYIYQVLQYASGEPRDRWPLGQRHCWCISQYLDIQSMNVAASTLLGTRDFASFGSAPNGGHTVRTLLQACWQDNGKAPEAFTGLLVKKLTFTVTANAFLYRMVRRLVSTLVKVGKGEWGLATVQALLAARDVSASPPPAPPQGLILGKVTYEKPLAELRSN